MAFKPIGSDFPRMRKGFIILLKHQDNNKSAEVIHYFTRFKPLAHLPMLQLSKDKIEIKKISLPLDQHFLIRSLSRSCLMQ